MPMSSRDRRALIGVGAIVILAAAVFFLFGHKGSKVPEASTLPQVNVNQGVPTPAPSPTKGKHKQVLVFSGRDPFCCQPATSPVAASSPVPGSTVVPAGSPSSGPSGGSSATFNGQTVVLVDIFTANGQEQAQVEVDGTVYTVSPGDSFAGDFALVSINGTCADFTFQGNAFSLCETANK
jgi:hypothetical protein